MSQIIQDARSYANNLLRNRFTTDEEFEIVIKVLDDHFKGVRGAAEADNRRDSNRDQFLFFQGAVMGMTIMAKTFRMHVEAQAFEQGTDLITGQPLKITNVD